MNDLSLLGWSNISSDYMDANTKIDIFYDQISQFINSHVPRRKLFKREIKLSTKPWITKPILAKFDIEISSIPKSLGVNSQIQILKTHISPLISSLMNDSFLCGIFPIKLKLAKVTPVFKKGSRQDKHNYRPIPVVSIFSKVFENAMFKRLYGYLESCNILFPLQFGFR